ncbi:flagellar hook-associated protein FlgK, partial [Candidatus Woesearchaeota archaeon]
IVKELVAVDNPSNNYYASIKIEDDLNGDDVVINGGELKGLLDIRDDTAFGIPSYQSQLDTLAYNLIQKVNAQHSVGFGLDGSTNVNFFAPVSSSTGAALAIQLDTQISDAVNGLNRIAASSTLGGIPGDGSNALALAQLANDTTGVGSLTFSEYYNSMISQLGVSSQEESKKVDNQSFLLDQLMNFRDNVSGVSLDEEAAKMITYQNAFNAASQVIKIMDEVYQTLIDLLG